MLITFFNFLALWSPSSSSRKWRDLVVRGMKQFENAVMEKD